MTDIAITSKPSIDWKAAIWAGIIGGIVFMVLEMAMVAIFLGKSPWGPPHMIAAIVLGKSVLPMPGGPPPMLTGTVLLSAMLVHFVLSIIFAFILAWVITGRTYSTAVGIGAVFGVLLYLVNFYILTGIFPWFAMARTWVTIFTHISFGIAAAISYMSLSGRAAPPQRTQMG